VNTPYDVAAARKVGIVSIVLRSGGFSDYLLRGAGASALYDSVADVFQHLDELPFSNPGHIASSCPKEAIARRS
jgi:hypothetical protein